MRRSTFSLSHFSITKPEEYSLVVHWLWINWPYVYMLVSVPNSIYSPLLLSFSRICFNGHMKHRRFSVFKTRRLMPADVRFLYMSLSVSMTNFPQKFWVSAYSSDYDRRSTLVSWIKGKCHSRVALWWGQPCASFIAYIGLALVRSFGVRD